MYVSVINFMLWAVSHLVERASDTHWIGGRVDLRKCQKNAMCSIQKISGSNTNQDMIRLPRWISQYKYNVLTQRIKFLCSKNFRNSLNFKKGHERILYCQIIISFSWVLPIARQIQVIKNYKNEHMILEHAQQPTVKMLFKGFIFSDLTQNHILDVGLEIIICK